MKRFEDLLVWQRMGETTKSTPVLRSESYGGQAEISRKVAGVVLEWIGGIGDGGSAESS